MPASTNCHLSVLATRRLRSAAAVVAVGVSITSALAVETDLSSVPLITSAPQEVKPNLMFILDDSGSMAWSHMPDTVEDFGRNGSGTAKYGYVTAQCNGVYYNPSIIYSPPVQVSSTGAISSYPASSFTSAWVNGYDTSAGTVDLSANFRAWSSTTVNNTNLDGTSDTAQAAYYYRYSGSQTAASQKLYLNSSSTFYQECNSLVGSTPGSGVFTKVTVSSSSGTGPAGADERTNFANWYSYYRTRMLMMKTATGRAFRGIDSGFRIGYMSINNNVDPSFLNIGDFGGTQKHNWYSKLYGASPSSSTPLRRALSDAGRIYANKISTLYGVSVTDPIQYSCQKNFTLLSTDGYWNSSSGYQLDGSTAVGNQDISEPRPYNDGGTVADVYTATITVSGADSSSDNVSSVTVSGSQILPSTADASGWGWGSRSEKLAQNITTRINQCTSGITGNCTVAGYKAVRSGRTVTITAPTSVGAISVTPSVTINSASASATAFAGSTVATGGTSDTLADVAQYYYQTDLRSSTLSNETGSLGTSVSANNVLPSGDDDADWQHMTTFTLGLGAPGRMIYSPTYKTDTTGDYVAVKEGSTASGSVCTWQTSGTTCNWPTPSSSDPENIDDLWHAAVNGRGTYFSASDPVGLTVGLQGAFQAINAMTSSSSAATTSNPNITTGDNYVFSSTFRSVEWYGDLERRQINVTTGALSTTADWTVAAQLDSNASRTIFTFDTATTSTTKLKPFQWANLTATERAYFTTTYVSSTSANPLSQFCSSGEICLSNSAQTAAGEATLIAFLRGDRTHEGPANDTSKYFRQRTRVLGDIVNSEAVYVRRPIYDYVDSGYSAFKTSKASRAGTVYVGANDGMLHAFDADTGAERWAYVPRLLMPKLYRLADKYYATNHEYYVDGSPTVGDVYFNGAWRTVLVGGFNAGGRGYFALDITDPSNPKGLWEFSDADLGYSYGRPEIAKLANGNWVAIFTSGYNNVNPGNGQGYLYVVDIETGSTTHKIGTGQGSHDTAVTGICATAPCPSGLAQIRAWVENTRYDNTVTKVYGGDLFGNVWRFDVNNTIGTSGVDAQLIATLRGPSPANNIQSVTARPELGKVAGYPVIFIGTGRYLGASDLNTSDTQTIYAIKDAGDTTSWGNPRSDTTSTGFVQQSLTSGTCGTSTMCVAGSTIRTGSSNTVNFQSHKGWFVDLPGTRERANTDPQLAVGILAVTTNLLNPSACTVGGSSFINYFDYKTGQAVSTAGGIASVALGSTLATRPYLFTRPDGTLQGVVRQSDGTTTVVSPPPPPALGATRRTSWRELTTR